MKIRNINEEFSILQDKYGDYLEAYESFALTKKVNGEVSREELFALGKQLENFDQYKKFTEESSQTDLGVLPSIALDVVTTSNVNSVIPLIASIQPLEDVQGLIYYKNVTANSNRDDVENGDTLVSAKSGRLKLSQGYGQEEVTNEDTGLSGDGETTKFTFTTKYDTVRLRSVTVTVENEPNVKGIDDGEGNIFGLGVKSGSIDYATGEVEIEFSEAPADGDEIFVSYATDFEKTEEIPTITSSFESQTIKARTFALRGISSLFKEYQMSKRFGIDGNEMVAKELVQELNAETSASVVAEAYMNSLGTVEWKKTPPDGISYTEHKLTFFDALSDAEATILGNAGRFLGGSVIIAGTSVAAIIRTMPGFESAEIQNSVLGTHYFGKLDGKPVIRSMVLPDNEAVILSRGTQFFDQPLVYAPYLPLFVSDNYQGVGKNPLQSQRVVATQAGIAAPVKTLITKLVVTE